MNWDFSSFYDIGWWVILIISILGIFYSRRKKPTIILKYYQRVVVKESHNGKIFWGLMGLIVGGLLLGEGNKKTK